MSVSGSGDHGTAPSAGHDHPATGSSGGGGSRDRAGQAPAGAPRAGFALLLTLSMAQFMVVLDFTIVNVALPSIQNGLHVATTTLQWLISGYAVAFGGFLLLGGRLADVYGRARLYRIGLVVFVVASIAGSLAVEPGLLITSRVVQGIGAAMPSRRRDPVTTGAPRRVRGSATCYAIACGVSAETLLSASVSAAATSGASPARLSRPSSPWRRPSVLRNRCWPIVRPMK